MAVADYADVINQAASQYGVSPDLLRAMIMQESGGNPNAIGPPTPSGRARGIAQIEPQFAPGVDTSDPTQSIQFMAKTMKQYLDKYGGDNNKALMAYYGGPNQKQWGPKTQAYPGQVLARMTPSAVQGDELPDLPHVGGATAAPTDTDALPELPAVPSGQAIPPGAPEVRNIPHVPLPELATEYLGSKAMEGAATIAGFPGDVLSWAGKPGYLPTSQTLNNALGRAGLVNQAYMQEAPPALKTAGGAVQGAVTALPFMALGPEGSAVPTLISGAAGGAGAEAAKEALPGSDVAPLVGGMLGGMAGGAGVNMAARGLNYTRGEVTPELAAFRTLGITPQSPAYTAAAGSKVLAPTDEIKTATESQLGSELEKTASTLGKSRTYEEAGTELQSGATRWLTNTLQQKLGQTWAPIDSVMPKDAQMNLSNFKQAVNDIAGGGGELQGLINKFKSTLPTQLKHQLDTLDTAKLVTGSNYDTNWQNAALLRRVIGEARGIPQIKEGISDKDLSRLYGALTDDMRDGLVEQIKVGKITGITPADLVGQYDKALADSEQLFGVANGTMKKIVNSTRPEQNTLQPGAVAKSLASKGSTDSGDLATLQQELPAETKELAAAHLRETGLKDPEEPGAPIDPAFARRWAALPQSTRQAMIPDAEQRARVEAAARLTARVGATGTKAKGGPGLGTIALSSVAGGQGFEHAGELIARYGLGGQSTGDILGPSAAAYLVGATAPIAIRAGRNALANSALAARYAGIPGATFGVRPSLVGGTAGLENILAPTDVPRARQQAQ